MFYFSRRSLAVLATLTPNLQRVCNKVLEDFDFTLIKGHRPEAEQNHAYYIGASTLPWDKSKHNKIPSEGVDASPWPIPENWGAIKDKKLRDILKEHPELTGKVIQKFRFFAFYFIGVGAGMGIKIRWGGDWDMDKDIEDQKFNDLIHLEEVT